MAGYPPGLLATELGERPINQAQLTLLLVGLATWSTAAMIAYPAILHHLGFVNRQAGFVLAAINSTGIMPTKIGEGATNLATAMLVCAVTATGIRSPMASLLETGPKPLLTISIASVVALVLSCLTAEFLIR